MRKRLRHTAVHEAGHAVIGRRLTLLCGTASIARYAPLDADGYAIVVSCEEIRREWELRGKFRDRASATRGRILTLMAGHEAELEILGRGVGCDEADRDAIADHLADLAESPERQAAMERRLRRAARWLVRRHRADIERVAGKLLDSITLTGDEIDALLPPGFMARPVTWAAAWIESADAGRHQAESVTR